MSFPAGLTLVTVTCQLDLLPDGGSAGKVRISYAGPLTGPTDDSIVPYIDETETLDEDGECTITVPATNDPGWTPQNFAYAVTTEANGRQRRGTLQLDYNTTAVNLADLVQWSGAATPGQTYIPLPQRGVAGGVAALDADGDVIDAAGAKLIDAVDAVDARVTALKGKAVSGITRDTQGRVTGYTEAGEVWSAITYDTSGRVSAFTVDGTAHAVTYNASGQIAGVS